MQRGLEQRGIATVSISVARDVTEKCKPPRAVFVPFRMGHHFGVPFHAQLQRRIIMEALTRVEQAQVSGEIYDLPLTWAQARMEGRAIEKQLDQSSP